MVDTKDLASSYERYFETVYCVAVSYGMQRADAEDVVQETFLRLLRADPAFESAEHEKAWLIVTAGNLCKSHFRKKARTELPLEEWSASSPPPDEEDIIFDCIRKLPENLRLTVHLYYFEGYKSREIAEMLKLHPGSVRRQLTRARNFLKKELKEWGEDWE